MPWLPFLADPCLTLAWASQYWYCTAFFLHLSVDSDMHLNFENPCRHSDFRDILRRQVNKKILKFFTDWPTFWWQRFKFFICLPKKAKFWLKTHPDSLLWYIYMFSTVSFLLFCQDNDFLKIQSLKCGQVSKKLAIFLVDSSS